MPIVSVEPCSDSMWLVYALRLSQKSASPRECRQQEAVVNREMQYKFVLPSTMQK